LNRDDCAEGTKLPDAERSCQHDKRSDAEGDLENASRLGDERVGGQAAPRHCRLHRLGTLLRGYSCTLKHETNNRSQGAQEGAEHGDDTPLGLLVAGRRDWWVDDVQDGRVTNLVETSLLQFTIEGDVDLLTEVDSASKPSLFKLQRWRIREAAVPF
jgi:hypothetical protein